MRCTRLSLKAQSTDERFSILYGYVRNVCSHINSCIQVWTEFGINCLTVSLTAAQTGLDFGCEFWKKILLVCPLN